jgi:hemoglobin-like flavoprotein
MLTQREIRLVQDDWAQVEQIADLAATLFYDRLFFLDPSVRGLFKEDMAEQKAKLVKMIGAAVYGLSNPDVLMPVVEVLGKRHVRFGVKNEDYATVGAALLWTLKHGLGAEAFDSEHEAAWIKAYGVLAERMKAAA